MDTQPAAASPAQGANQGSQSKQRTHQHYQDWFTGDGARTRFALSHTPRDVSQLAVYVAGLRKRPKDRATAFDFSLAGSVVVFVVAPAVAAAVCIDQTSV